MPAPRKPPSAELPLALCEEITEVARRTRRSVAFIVARALAAAKGQVGTASGNGQPGPRGTLALTLDEDDPPKLLTQIKQAAGERPLGAAVAAAWLEARPRFLAWMAREEAAQEAERADDLDQELAEAEHPQTSPERLAALAKSSYPRVRALVAAHARTPIETLEVLGKDREPFVREKVAANPNRPGI